MRWFEDAVMAGFGSAKSRRLLIMFKMQDMVMDAQGGDIEIFNGGNISIESN